MEIKEANVLSKRMQQDGEFLPICIPTRDTTDARKASSVTYNFLVSDAAPTSALNDFLDVDETPASSVSRPTIYVKVLDFRSKGPYSSFSLSSPSVLTRLSSS